MKNKFRRVNEHAWLGGVLGGLAYAFGFPTWIVRALFVLLATSTAGGFVVAYIIVGLLAPKWSTDPADYSQVCE